MNTFHNDPTQYLIKHSKIKASLKAANVHKNAGNESSTGPWLSLSYPLIPGEKCCMKQWLKIINAALMNAASS